MKGEMKGEMYGEMKGERYNVKDIRKTLEYICFATVTSLDNQTVNGER